jgi:hypothetical protein
MVRNLRAWRDHVLQRLDRQHATTGDAALKRLRDELAALPVPAESATEALAADPPDVAVPLTLHGPWGTLNFITTITVFGAPHDVTLAELAVETLLPADAATAAALRALHAAVPD